MTRALCIVNPAAGGRVSPLSDLPDVLDRLRAGGFDLTVRETEPDRPSAEDLAREALGGGYEACLVAGGDGTVQAAARVLIGHDVVLGILPFGSFMNIAHGLGIPLEARKAVDVILARRVTRADVGRVAGEHVFFETAGIGVDAEIFAAARLLERRRLRGALRRVRRALAQGSHRVEVVVDGNVHQHRAVQILVANSPYYLWAVKIADSRMDDGLLEVAVYSRMGRVALLRALVDLIRRGYHPRRPVTYRGASIELRSREALTVHADGTLAGRLPIGIDCWKGALPVYAPSG